MEGLAGRCAAWHLAAAAARGRHAGRHTQLLALRVDGHHGGEATVDVPRLQGADVLGQHPGADVHRRTADMDRCQTARQFTRVDDLHLTAPASFTHRGSPLYWDTVAGTALDRCLEASVRWLLVAGCVQAELWGCRQYPDGGYSAPQPLVRSRSVSLAKITRMAGTSPTFVFDAQPGWEDNEGEPFALAVHRRLRALVARAPPLGGEGEPRSGGPKVGSPKAGVSATTTHHNG